MFWRDNSGASAVEYALLAAAIGVAVVVGGNTLVSIVNQIGTQQQDVLSGLGGPAVASVGSTSTTSSGGSSSSSTSSGSTSGTTSSSSTSSGTTSSSS